MPRIRLLTAAPGPGPVTGAAGEVLNVDARTAQEWADGVRAERVVDRDRRPERTDGRG